MPRLKAAVLAAGLTAIVLLAVSARAEEPARFTLSLDPTVAVLSVTYTSVLGGGGAREHVLYGDGRLEILKRGRHGDVREKFEILFTYTECEELLRVLVDHGIIETSTDDLIAKIKKGVAPDHTMYITEDAGDMILEIHLESYAKPNQEPRAVNTRLRIHAPKAMYRIVPDLLELQGLFAFNNRMEDLYRAAKNSTEEK